jgi:hypothetical protein
MREPPTLRDLPLAVLAGVIVMLLIVGCLGLLWLLGVPRWMS